MFFAFIILNLILSVNFSLQAKSDDGRRHSNDDSDNSKKESKEADKAENVIKKSDLEELLRLKNQYMVKNYIEDFETHLAIHFVPNWTDVNSFSSPARQSIDIRRQKWNFIFDKFGDSAVVKRLNAELKKAGINRTAFCDDIAEIYFTLSHNALIFDKPSVSEKKQKTFPFPLNPNQENSLLVFMNSIFDFKTKSDKNQDMVKIPKELYIDLMRIDAHAAMMQYRHNEVIKRLKKAYRNKVQDAKEGKYVDSEISSY